jgi:hypothetical protein
MDMSEFRHLPISELRPRLAKLRPFIQTGKLRLCVTCYGDVLGYLVPIFDIDQGNMPEGIVTQEMPLTKFRDSVHDARDAMILGTDCIYLTFHSRKIIALVHSRLHPYLPIPNSLALPHFLNSMSLNQEEAQGEIPEQLDSQGDILEKLGSSV